MSEGCSDMSGVRKTWEREAREDMELGDGRGGGAQLLSETKELRTFCNTNGVTDLLAAPGGYERMRGL